MNPMSEKTKRILALWDGNPALTSAEVAEAVGCRPEYARVVRQRYRMEKPNLDPRVSTAALADRRRRQDALARRDLTATLMGDPPPRF